MMLTTYIAQLVAPEAFVDFWAQQYAYGLEHLYTANIGQRLTPERIGQLFEWKNGSRLSEAKRRSVEKNYIAHIARLEEFALEAGAKDFLNAFATGGAIWRIFWLHCWRPKRFPIYDQHVRRWFILKIGK